MTDTPLWYAETFGHGARGWSPCTFADEPQVTRTGHLQRSDDTGPRIRHIAPVPAHLRGQNLRDLQLAHARGEFGTGIASPEIHTGPDQAEPHRKAVALIDPPAAWTDVLAERQRQVTGEGWTADHDDKHTGGQLALAATCYAWIAAASDDDRACYVAQAVPVEDWPWANDHWKPTTPRRDMIKAAALLLAEIERLDRAGGADHG